ncbi:Imm50 family immunity protein [Enterobacter ludwigii]|uniref:Imm50 family immunity protein n=1 Tax=Enterobacterales TaxID=91347 RepID=UPI0013D94A7C|nr:Imm50 family immunity protein [Serratia marcescens]
MWFDALHGKEKINFMFNNELSLHDAEFENILFYDMSRVRICFKTRHVPKSIPDKWKKKPFNGLSVTLELVGINKLELKGNRVGFKCTPIIKRLGGEVEILIEYSDVFLFSCTAEVIAIGSIEPYQDRRWV